MRVWPGRSNPLGATWDGASVNFALSSDHASNVELCLFESQDDPTGRKMPEPPISVLLVDDNEEAFILIRHLLANAPGSPYALEWEPDYDTAISRICEGRHEVYLINFQLDNRSGVELLREAHHRGCKGPFLILTGQGQHELDLEAMQAGAADFLEKGQMTAALLERSIRYALQEEHSAAELQRRVEERTAEVALVNRRLKEEIRERERTEDALREASRLKDEFLAMLAHELRNPLAPLRNALCILQMKEPPQPDVAREAVEMMTRQVEHLVRLVDDLLDVSRVTRGKINLQKERTDLATVVARAVESSRPLIDEHRHSLEVAVPDIPVPIDADAVRLSQVFLNLLNNAAKYTPRGGKIRLSVEVLDGKAVIRVRDTGIGISAAMLPKIFDLFTQADRSLERTEGGLGIGLTLVKRLTEMHGGKVHAASAGPGQGSEFEVRLPVLTAPAKADPVKGSAKQRARVVSTRRRILIVDDNRDSANSLAILLRLLGNEVQTALGGQQALDDIPSFLPEVVVMDIAMPGLTGLEVARRVRDTPSLPQPLLVAVTGFGSEEDRRQALSAGFNAHLVKPLDLNALQTILSRKVEDEV
jgi:signal transduction histidine kinase